MDVEPFHEFLLKDVPAERGDLRDIKTWHTDAYNPENQAEQIAEERGDRTAAKAEHNSMQRSVFLLMNTILGGGILGQSYAMYVAGYGRHRRSRRWHA